MDHSINYSQVLPKCVANYLNQRSRPQIQKPIVDLDEDLTQREKVYKHWFKCSGYESECDFTCDNSHEFHVHLVDGHKILNHSKPKYFCLYCSYPLTDDTKKELMDAKKLIVHMISVHKHRRYQCNLCLYRAISADHVNIHQKVIHPEYHKTTLKKKQLNGKSCKILRCPPVSLETANQRIPSDVEIYNNHKHRRLNNDETHNKDYQCVYCNYMNESITKVVEHCVQSHADYHILYYIPEPNVTSTQSPISLQPYQEIDFLTTNTETQDNRVTSTEESLRPVEGSTKNKTKQINDYITEHSFGKKARKSFVQTSSPKKHGMSSKYLNRGPIASTSRAPQISRPKDVMPVKHNANKNWKPNQLQTKLQNKPKPKQLKRRLNYLSDDESDDILSKVKSKSKTNSEDIEEEDEIEIIKDDNEVCPPPVRPLTTTIEVVDPEVEEYICLFCDNTFSQHKAASDHFLIHFPEIDSAMDDKTDTVPVVSWISEFLRKQTNLLEKESDYHHSHEYDHHFKCPICVKIAKMKSLRPKQFRTLWEMKVHFWEHTVLKTVHCLKCEFELPNCDHLIAQHLNGKHYEELENSDDSHIKEVKGNKVKNDFTPQQKTALVKKGFIQLKGYEPLNTLIDNILKDISNKNESFLREKASKEKKMTITLPNLILKPLPFLNFDDVNMVCDYIEKCEPKSIPSTSFDCDSPIKRYKCYHCNGLFENQKEIKDHSKCQHKDLPISFKRI